MRYVKFLFEKEVGNSVVKYPDSKELFSGVVVGKDGYLRASYEGVLPLEEASILSGTSAIRNITTGAMQSRFTIMEEVAIIDGANSFSKVLLARLMNARYAGLDQTETQEGVAYIVNFLDSVGAIDQGVTPSVRVDKLLEDGLPIEEFLGELQQVL